MRVPYRDLFLTLLVLAGSAGLVRVFTLPQAAEPAVPGPVQGVDREGVAAALNDAMADVVERILPGVVSVHTDRQQVVQEVVKRGPLGVQVKDRTVRQPGVGSGVIVRKDGLVLTNWHVVAGEDVLIQVNLHGNEEPRRAKLVDEDESMDIALLQIELKQPEETFPWMVFGDSDLMRPGHLVFAVGAPLNLPETVTQGIISNRERRVSDTLESYLQTDCTINPGNSGGPLVNFKGELIGINTRLVIGPQEAPSGQAYGLAIPGNEVQDAYERMISKGRPRGYLGVTVGDWPDMSYQTGRQPEAAVVVGVDQGSPAAAAGLRKDDVIQSMDGEPVRSRAEFFRRLRKRPVGETLSLELKRGGERLTVSAAVVDLKTIFEAEEVPESREIAGLTVRGLRRGERVRFALPDRSGVLIVAVAEGSPLHGKVTPGEVILRVTESAMEPAPRVQDVVECAARMEIVKLKGGTLDVLRKAGSIERLTFSPQPSP
jgi:serine protease Do